MSIQINRLEEGSTVLYVDDELLNLRVFEANFRSRLNVVTCLSGREALEIISQRGSDIGVLIADQRMPEMTGVELLERVRVLAPDVQRMLITAYSEMQSVIDAVNRGQVTRYFVKPWVKEELLAALEDAVRISGLQSKLREVEARMMQSERLATIGQVSAGIAHELMNPISYMSQNIGVLRDELKIISAYVEPLLKNHPNDEVQQTLTDLPLLLSDVETGSNHIREVALGIRTQVQGDDEEAYSNLADVVGFAVKLARAEIRQRARVVVKGQSSRVHGGPVKLCQVLLNLIVNAAHAMEGTGRAGFIEIDWEDSADRVCLTVSDNGLGIPPELLEKIFQPMFTTKAPGKGTGLGLSITRDIVHRLNGEIVIKSEVGVGTSVEIKLPKAP